VEVDRRTSIAEALGHPWVKGHLGETARVREAELLPELEPPPDRFTHRISRTSSQSTEVSPDSYRTRPEFTSLKLWSSSARHKSPSPPDLVATPDCVGSSLDTVRRAQDVMLRQERREGYLEPEYLGLAPSPRLRGPDSCLTSRPRACPRAPPLTARHCRCCGAPADYSRSGV
jgi:hypothetical protein